MSEKIIKGKNPDLRWLCKRFGCNKKTMIEAMVDLLLDWDDREIIEMVDRWVAKG